MFDRFEQLSVGEQFERLILPRGDWFDSQSLQAFLIQAIPWFESLGHPLRGGSELVDICRAGDMGQHVVQTRSPTGISGLKTDFPQHAGLVELGSWESVETRRLSLAAFTMLCVDAWSERLARAGASSQAMEVLGRRLGEVWRAIRLTSTRALSLMPPVTEDIKAFHNGLESALDALDPRDEALWGRDIDYLRLLLRFVNYYLGGGQVYTGSRLGGEHDDNELETHWIRISPADADSEVQPESCADEVLITRETLFHIRKSEHFQCGNSPEELEGGPRLGWSEKPVSIKQGGSAAQAATRLKYRQVHQRRNAQSLPGRWSALNDFEIRTFGVSLNSQNGELDIQVLTTLWLMLLTGRVLEDALNARVVRRMEQIPKNLNADNLYLVADAGEWVVETMRPVNRRKTRQAWQSVLQQHEDRLQLPIPAPIWATIGPFIKSRGRHSKARSAALLPSADAAGIEDRGRQFLNQLNRKNKTRLTLARVSYQLTEDLHRISGDLIEANLITGREPPFGASAALYYHHRDRQALVDHYTAVTDHWERIIFSSKLAAPARQKALIDGAVGSGLVLRTDVVQGLFRALSRQVEYDRSLLGTLEGLRAFHNSLTDYVLMMTLWLTGYRAVQDPIAQTSEFNAPRRLLVVADKTGDGYGHSRMVPVCAVLVDQLLTYQSHVEWLRNRLALVGRRTHNTLFFYLDDDLREVQVRPASMSRFLEWAYVLPLNLNRHWLRGVLRSQRVPGPQVDRFMGHWSMGQEPWGRFSGVDPYEFHRILEGALNQLVADFDLKVVGGLA